VTTSADSLTGSGAVTVGVDARTVYAPTRRGTGKNLVDLYSIMASRYENWRFLMFHQLDARDDPFDAFPNVRHVQVDVRGDRFNLWQDVRLPIAAWTHDVDVLHCPANTAPYRAIRPTVLTIHDLIPLDTAPGASATRSWYTRVRRSARAACRIITPSEYTKQRVVTQLGAPADAVVVNPWAPDRKCRRVTDATVLEAVRTRYQIPTDRYVLAFGAEDPRKNTLRVLRAWTRVPAGVSATLAVIGLQPTALGQLQLAVQTDRSLGSAVVLHGFAAEDDIGALLSGAAALCYPSLSEGFGLPVVDAFQCGTPVVTSRTTSLPEVAGEAAILVDPTSEDEIAAALCEVLTSEKRRETLRAAGFERVKLFSWDRCAQNTAQALAAAAGRN
jgi:glycosyltransferase involved in cell wall biosynthesis